MLGRRCDCDFCKPPTYGPPRPTKCYLCDSRRQVDAIWCDECLEKERNKVMSQKVPPVAVTAIERARHDDLMLEVSGKGYHLEACTCGWCKPLPYVRSADFMSAKAQLRGEVVKAEQE